MTDASLPQPVAAQPFTGPQPPARPVTLVGDSERDLVCDQLSLHFAAGRLTHEEFDHRTLAALQSRSRAELGACLAGLPVPQLPIVAQGATATQQPRNRLPRTARQGAMDLLVGLLSASAALCLLVVMMAAVLSQGDSDFAGGLLLGALGAGTAAAGFSHLLHTRQQ